MLVILENLREVVAQSVCIAISLSEMICIEVCRLILDGSCVTYVICSKTIESVILLAVVVKTAFNLEVKVLDDMPCDSTVDCPV